MVSATSSEQQVQTAVSISDAFSSATRGRRSLDSRQAPDRRLQRAAPRSLAPLPAAARAAAVGAQEAAKPRG